MLCVHKSSNYEKGGGANIANLVRVKSSYIKSMLIVLSFTCNLFPIMMNTVYIFSIDFLLNLFSSFKTVQYPLIICFASNLSSNDCFREEFTLGESCIKNENTY